MAVQHVSMHTIKRSRQAGTEEEAHSLRCSHQTELKHVHRNAEDAAGRGQWKELPLEADKTTDHMGINGLGAFPMAPKPTATTERSFRKDYGHAVQAVGAEIAQNIPRPIALGVSRCGSATRGPLL